VGLGKNAYALAFGNSDFSKILINNKNPMDEIMKKSMNPED
jgi:hypothetical protein